MMKSRIEALGNAHSLSIMIYVLEHDGCTKLELYDDVVRNSRMPDKLNALEDEGLIMQIPDGRATRIFITDKGIEVATLVRRAAEVMDRDDWAFDANND